MRAAAGTLRRALIAGPIRACHLALARRGHALQVQHVVVSAFEPNIRSPGSAISDSGYWYHLRGKAT